MQITQFLSLKQEIPEMNKIWCICWFNNTQRNQTVLVKKQIHFQMDQKSDYITFTTHQGVGLTAISLQTKQNSQDCIGITLLSESILTENTGCMQGGTRLMDSNGHPLPFLWHMGSPIVID